MMYLVEFHRGFAAFNSPREMSNVINQDAKAMRRRMSMPVKNMLGRSGNAIRGCSPLSQDLRIGKRQDSILLQVFR